MVTKWKRIRGTGIYKAILYFLTVLLIPVILSNLAVQAINFKYEATPSQKYFEADMGASHDVSQAISQLTSDYINETVANQKYDFLYKVTGWRGTFTNEVNPQDLESDSRYIVQVEGSAVRLAGEFPREMPLHIIPEDTPDMTISFDKGWIEAKEDIWLERSAELQSSRNALIAGTVFLFLLIAEQVAVVGRNAQGKLTLHTADRIVSEPVVLAFAVAVWLSIRLFFVWTQTISSQNQGTLVFYLLVLAVSIAWGLLLFLIRRFKLHTLFRNSILGALGVRFMRVLTGGKSEIPEAKRVFRILLGFSLLLMVLGFSHIALGMSPGTLLFLGALLTAIMLYATYSLLNRIEDGVEHAVHEQLASERMKVDLVTNVSHDLNTPLTSIIGYVDLLQDEEMSVAARDYVNVLQKKSLRLKGIVSDLFDLSKSTSGTVEVHRERLNYSVLITQTLADLEDTIRNRERHIVTKMPDAPVYVYADGKQLYRILQNLIDNALRYSAPETRIFLTLDQDDGYAHLKLKNVSAYPLDFDEQEILSRFVRGDLSRSEEGSGLGLAIAKSFTENNDGAFQVFVQEDTFIAYQTLRVMTPDNE